LNGPESNGSAGDSPRRRYAFWLRILALVVALALAAWFVDILIVALLHSAAH
jgi:hypothetical protein